MAPQLTARTGMEANVQGRAGGVLRALRGLGSDLGRATTTIMLCAHVGVVEKGEVWEERKKTKKNKTQASCFFQLKIQDFKVSEQ